jgi:Predicted hydrolases of HD superfamily
MARDYFIHTASGGRFFYGQKMADISIDDIAHHLSNVARFCGATKFHYSVAQHACLVAYILEQAGYGADTQFYGLHHDDHEAYMNDSPTPFQHWLRDEICHGVDYLAMAKNKLDNQIMPRVGVSWPPSESAERAVDWADKLAFVTEASQLFKETPDWLDEWIERIGNPIDFTLAELVPSQAEKLYTKVHNYLLEKRGSNDYAGSPQGRAA